MPSCLTTSCCLSCWRRGACVIGFVLLDYWLWWWSLRRIHRWGTVCYFCIHVCAKQISILTTFVSWAEIRGHCGGRSCVHPMLCQSLIHVILITNVTFAQPQSNTDKPLLVTPIATDEPRQRVHISSDDRGGLKIGQQAMVTIAQNYWFNYSQMFLNLVVVKAYFQLRLLPLSH